MRKIFTLLIVLLLCFSSLIAAETASVSDSENKITHTQISELSNLKTYSTKIQSGFASEVVADVGFYQVQSVEAGAMTKLPIVVIKQNKTVFYGIKTNSVLFEPDKSADRNNYLQRLGFRGFGTDNSARAKI